MLEQKLQEMPHQNRDFWSNINFSLLLNTFKQASLLALDQCGVILCHDFSELAQGALKLDLLFCWIMTSGICERNELQPSAGDFKAVYKWNLGQAEVNSKSLYSFLEQTPLISEIWTFCENIWTRFGVAWISGLRLQGEDIPSLRVMERPCTSCGMGAGAGSHQDPEHPKLSLPPLCRVSAPLLQLMLPHPPWLKHEAGNTEMILVLERDL